MSYLNKKEQVLDIELTQFGKELLAAGKFKPAFYQFFDDDILYDTNKAGFEEDQNDTELRIREAQRQTTQYMFTGVSLKLAPGIQASQDKFFSTSTPMGESDHFSSKAPAFNLKFMRGEVSSSAGTISNSYQILKIPQLELRPSYTTRVLEDGIPTDNLDKDRVFNFSTEAFEDGTVLHVDGEYILLEIAELNSIFEKENFEIEVFEVEQTVSCGDVLKPLYFYDSISKNEQSNVGYFLDILTDGEIDSRLLCKTTYQPKSGGIFVEPPKSCNDLVDIVVGEEYNNYDDILDDNSEEIC